MSGSEGWVANHGSRKTSHQPLLQPLAQMCKCPSFRIFTREHHIPYTSWRNCSNFSHSTSQQISTGCIIKVWVLKLFVAGKEADLALSAGDYHMKFNIKNLGNKSSFPQEKGAAKYPGLQVQFPALWDVPAASTGLWRRSGWSGVLTVQRRVQARNQQVGFNIHETHAHWIKVICGANWRSQQ